MKSEITGEELISSLEELYGRPLDLPLKGNISKDSPEYQLWAIEYFVTFTRYKEMARRNLYDSLVAAVQRGERLDYENLNGWPTVPKRYYTK